MSRIKTDRPIDPKTAIMDEKQERAFMDSFRGNPCECCGICDGTIVPAHLNMGIAGTGYRAKGIVAGLCGKCHDIADGRVPASEADRLRIWVKVCQKLLRDRARAFRTVRLGASNGKR